VFNIIDRSMIYPKISKKCADIVTQNILDRLSHSGTTASKKWEVDVENSEKSPYLFADGSARMRRHERNFEWRTIVSPHPRAKLWPARRHVDTRVRQSSKSSNLSKVTHLQLWL